MNLPTEPGEPGEPGDVVDVRQADARRRQDRLRLLAQSFRETFEKLADLVEEAKASNDHKTLGYLSWTAYLADTLGAEPLRLDREHRREVVALLAGEGISTRAIAPIVGVSQKTVDRDVGHVSHRDSRARIAPVIGLDGRAYHARAGARQGRTQRFPITATAGRLAYDFGKVIDRLDRLAEDDRLDRNREALSDAWEAVLCRAVLRCNSLVARLAAGGGEDQ